MLLVLKLGRVTLERELLVCKQEPFILDMELFLVLNPLVVVTCGTWANL